MSRRDEEVRVKRRGKSPPPQARARGHDKPRAVQDKTGGSGRLPGFLKETDLRVIVAAQMAAPASCRSKINDRHSIPPSGGMENKIRLTAIIKRERPERRRSRPA